MLLYSASIAFDAIGGAHPGRERDGFKRRKAKGEERRTPADEETNRVGVKYRRRTRLDGPARRKEKDKSKGGHLSTKKQVKIQRKIEAMYRSHMTKKEAQ